MNASKRKVIDAHVHFYDHKENRHDFLEHNDEMLEALLGDYSALPRQYSLQDYLTDEPDVEIAGLVWHEFLSSDPVREVLWAQRLSENMPFPMSIVGLVDFLGSDLENRLETYSQCPGVVGVREHLAWHENNALRRFARCPDLLNDSRWLQGLKILEKYRFKCSLEVFSPQLPDLLRAVRLNPNIGFTIAVMGWPVRTNDLEFTRWRRSLAELSQCQNVRIVISALECIFGMEWSLPQAQRWIQAVFDLFGPERTMFGGHHPICGLSTSFSAPYIAYEKMCANLSTSEQDAVFRLNAAEWFFSGASFSMVQEAVSSPMRAVETPTRS
ncbi:MAG TPA: amidohydrolase family protein [Bryobacteraceae bacterium]|nr:amidohydrolase family protein [Bryobacteraceae bacterium]